MNLRPTLSALVVPLLIACPAQAEEGCSVTGSLVELRLEVDPPDRFIATALERHLRAELRARQLGLCTALPDGARPVARVRLHIAHPAGGQVLATLEVRDEVTDKRLERVLNLTGLPSDARPLAVATSVDELLRASWVELTIPDAPAPAMPPPPAVVVAVEASRPVLTSPPAPSPGLPRFEVGLAATVSVFPRRTALGAQVAGLWWWHPRLGTSLRVGGSLGGARTGAHGSASMDTTDVGLGLVVALTPRSRPQGLEAEAGVSVLRTRAAGEATGGNEQLTSQQDATVAGAGVAGWFDLWRLRLTVGLRALQALRPVRASDTGIELTSIAGTGVEGSLGLSARLP